jgi:hypothetical protein
MSSSSSHVAVAGAAPGHAAVHSRRGNPALTLLASVISRSNSPAAATAPA